MLAPPNSGHENPGAQLKDLRFDRRTAIRYRLAQLLLSEKFDLALQEALQARQNDEILPSDLEFVLHIIRTAERRGRSGPEPESYPGESLAKALGIPAPSSVSR